MKTSRSENNRQSKQGFSNKPVPAIRSNKDSRNGEEQDDKGGNVTHNRKEHHHANKTVMEHLNRRRDNTHASRY
jgi:hypothetical protein